MSRIFIASNHTTCDPTQVFLQIKVRNQIGLMAHLYYAYLKCFSYYLFGMLRIIVNYLKGKKNNSCT